MPKKVVACLFRNFNSRVSKMYILNLPPKVCREQIRLRKKDGLHKFSNFFSIVLLKNFLLCFWQIWVKVCVYQRKKDNLVYKKASYTFFMLYLYKYASSCCLSTSSSKWQLVSIQGRRWARQGIRSCLVENVWQLSLLSVVIEFFINYLPNFCRK